MKYFFGLILSFAVSIGFTQSLVESRQQEIVFRFVNVVPMDSERILENQDVVVKGGKITAIGVSGKVKFEKNATIIDAKGKYMIPGLAEIHAHVPPIDDIEPMREVLTLFVANGVTTIRGMLGHPRHIELRAKINSGEILGPHFYTSGPSFNGLSVKTPEGADKMVREQKAIGYDFLKLHPGLTLANFNAMVKTAKEVNIPFAGHVSSGVGVWRAIDAGYASIDHMDGFIEGMVPGIEKMTDQEIGFFGLFASKKVDETKIPALMKALKDHKIWVVPTQCLAERWIAPTPTGDELRNAPEMLYMDTKTLDSWSENKKRQIATPGYNETDALNFVKLRKKLIYECQKNGVGLLLGSDAPQVFNVPGFSIHHELKYLVDAGLTPYEALRSGTVNVASFLNHPDWGTIKTGNVSDLVLLSGNPLKDIQQTSKIEGVMLGSQWLSKEYIKAELKKLTKR
ncbi:amidohydrolase family protein [soil metagenome]